MEENQDAFWRETYSQAAEEPDKPGYESWLEYACWTGQAPPNTSNTPVFKRSISAVSDPFVAALRKKDIDRRYREKCKRVKAEMQGNLQTLKEENDSLKKKNESLKMHNADMNKTLEDQSKEMERLKNDLSQLKREGEKQNLLVQTLSRLMADPVRLENEKLKEQIASLRQNANLNNIDALVEENSKLKIQNKVLQVQNDALCGKIISDNRKREQEQES